MSKKDLKVTLIGEDKTGGAFGSASGNAAKFGKAVGLAAVAAGAAIGAFVAKGVKDAVELETAMSEVFTLLPGSSKKAMDAMTGDVLAFSSEMGIATTEAVPALYQALSAGVPKENVFAFMEDAGKLGIAGVTDLKTATGVLALAVNNFTGEGLSATQASDLLFTAVRVGTTTMDELSGAVANVGPGAAALGIEFKEVTGALAAMTSTSGNAQQSSTQLRAMLNELGKETSVVGRKFAEVSGQSFTQFTASGGTLQQALALLGEETAKTGRGAESLFGSVEAGMGVLALSGENAAKFTGAMAAMGDSAGATDVAFQTMEQSVSRQWEKLKVQVQNFGIEIGQKLLPVISAAIEQMVVWFDKLVAWWDVNGPAISAAATDVGKTVAAVAGTIKDAIGSVTKFLTDHTNVAKGVFATLGALFVAWGVAATINAAKNVAAWAAATASTIASAAVHAAQVGAMVVKWAFLGAQSLAHAAKVAAAWLIAMGPIGLVIAAVVAVVALIVANWGTIARVTADLWNKVKALTSAAWSALTGAVSSGVSSVIGVVSGLPGRILGALGNLGGLLVGAGRALMTGLASGIGDAVGSVVAKAREAAARVVNAVKGAFGINSPSRVFAEIGSNLGDGMALGMDRSQSQVRASAVDMLDLAGLKSGLPGFTQGRLAATAAGAPVEGARLSAPSSGGGMTAEQGERLISLMAALPRTVQAMDRQGVARG